MTDPTDLPAPTPAVTAWLQAHARQYGSGEPYYLDDAGGVILDSTKPGVPNADTAGAARWLQRNRPELFDQPKPTITAPTPTTDEAVAALFAKNAVAVAKSEPSPINYTKMMTAARQGDAAALATMMNRYT